MHVLIPSAALYVSMLRMWNNHLSAWTLKGSFGYFEVGLNEVHIYRQSTYSRRWSACSLDQQISYPEVRLMRRDREVLWLVPKKNVV